MAANGKPKRRHINLLWNDRPVPAYEKLIVGSEDTAVESLKRRCQQGRSCPLKNHFRLLREGYSQVALCWSDRQTEIDCVAFGPNRKRCQCAASGNCSFQKIATG